jgi:hypothetical protein
MSAPAQAPAKAARTQTTARRPNRVVFRLDYDREVSYLTVEGRMRRGTKPSSFRSLRGA